MTFKYRFVDFNTRFVGDAGIRSSRDEPAHLLMANEIAVDVGGECWDAAGEAHAERTVIDHHFYRPHQFPSASAAVLHNAARIRERFSALPPRSADDDSGAKVGGLPGRSADDDGGEKGGASPPGTDEYSGAKTTAFETVWLVTHVQPDFDAFAAGYLVRALLSGSADQPQLMWTTPTPLPSGGWNPAAAPIDWFDPDLRALPPEQRWWVLIASYASHVDNGRRLSCPRSRALHSMLYAALKRGRQYLAEDSGAVEFFDEVRARITWGLNPLTDSVLEESDTFRPELAFLDREEAAYARDLRAARRAVVYLPQLSESFEAFYRTRSQAPLLDAAHHLRPAQAPPPGRQLRPTDGIYLRNPECLLFKEWARLDVESSPSQRGFAFTAVAYSGGRRAAAVNTTDYFFSVDPEAAEDRHLYPVWAALQAEEIRALHRAEHDGLRQALVNADGPGAQSRCRHGYEGRAADLAALFDDPWFDGANYKCTIVATPTRGTVIGLPGTRSDLTDDPVVSLVARALEQSVFTGPLDVHDLPPVAKPAHLPRPVAFVVADGPGLATDAPAGHYRFGTALLDHSVDLEAPQVAPQIGAVLWQFLYPGGRKGLPDDFASRHLLMHPDWIGVWSRHGVMLAHKPAATPVVTRMRDAFTDLVALAGGVQALVGATAPPDAGAAAHGESHAGADSLVSAALRGDDLMQRIAALRQKLALPEYRLIQRFFEATQLDDVLSLIRDVNIVARQDLQNSATSRSTSALARMQAKLEWLEVLFISFYATELVHILFTLLKGHHAMKEVLLSFLTVGIATGLVAYYLRPWHGAEAEGGRLRPLVAFLILVWLVAVVFAQYHWFTDPSPPLAGAGH